MTLQLFYLKKKTRFINYKYFLNYSDKILYLKTRIYLT